MTALKHTWFMTLRHSRILLRQPWYIAFTLVRPAIYLLLFGALFRRVAELPGFDTGSYITFLTPGIVVMSALFSAGWSGMSVITDLDRGVLDRFLVSPVARVSLITGRLVQLAIVTIVQSAIIVGLGLIVGARFDGGPLGLLVLVGSAILLAAPFGALSCGMALLARKEESVIGAVNFVLMPLMYLSSVLIAATLMPEWMQAVSRFNPVEWSVEAGRVAIAAQVDWGLVATRAAYLAAFAVACAWLATRAFRTYQRSV
jgi:ABC-2 type transport system permease protein